MLVCRFRQYVADIHVGWLSICTTWDSGMTHAEARAGDSIVRFFSSFGKDMITSNIKGTEEAGHASCKSLCFLICQSEELFCILRILCFLKVLFM